MSRTRPYPPEYRQQIIELARAGRSAYELAQEFEPSYWTIHQWIKQADRDEGRHGLIVIIALGESLIVAGSGLTSGVTPGLMVTGAIAVLATCLLWWTYFGWIAEVMETELTSQTGVSRARLARDAYTLWHFPLVSGIVALAVGFEASFHPDDYALIQITVAVGVGLTLFLTSTAAALRRAKGCILWNRLIVLIITLGGLALGATSSVNQILGTACVGLALIVAIEQVTVRRRMARA